MKRRRWALVLLGGAAAVLVAVLPFKGPVHDAILRAWHLRKLEKGDWQAQRRAAGELARLHAEEAIPVLIRMADEREKLAWIVPTLVRIGPRGAEAALDSFDVDKVLWEIQSMGLEGLPALEPVLRIIRDPDGKFRSQAAGVLGGIAAPGAIAALIDCLSDPDAMLRREAAASLKHIGPPARAAITPIVHQIATGVAIDGGGEALAAIDPSGTEAVHVLLQAVNEAMPSGRIEIALTLTDFKDQGSKLVSIITDGLGEGQIEVRRMAANALQSILVDRMPFSKPSPQQADLQSPALSSALIQAVSDPDSDIRSIAVNLLPFTVKKGPDGEPSGAAAALLALLKDRDRRLALDAARALAALGVHGEEVVPVILEAAKNHPREGSMPANFEAYPDPAKSVVPSLVSALSDPDPWVREAATQALIYLKVDLGPVIDSLSALLREGDARRRLNAAEALEGLGPGAAPAVQGLINALKDDDGSVVHAAIRALGEIGPAAAKVSIPALIDILGKSQPHFAQKFAIESLVKMGSEAVGPLVSALDHPLPQVRSGAIEALGKIASPGIDLVPALIKSLKDPESQVRFAAMESLGAHGRGSGAALSALTALIKDPEIEVRLRAAKAIVAAGGPARLVLPTLIAALSEDLSAANMQLWPNEVLATLGSEAGPAVPALIERLRKEPLEPPLFGAVVTLAAIGPAASEAIPALEDLRRIAFEEYFRTAIDEALDKIRGAPNQP